MAKFDWFFACGYAQAEQQTRAHEEELQLLKQKARYMLWTLQRVLSTPPRQAHFAEELSLKREQQTEELQKRLREVHNRRQFDPPTPR